MTTKQYLNQANSLNRRIKMLQTEIDKLRELSTSVSANVAKERVQSSGSKDALANAVATILEKEDTLAATIMLYTDSKDILRRQIEDLGQNVYTDVLYGRYVVGMTFFQISLVIGKQERQVFNIHSEALEKFEKKHGHLYK